MSKSEKIDFQSIFKNFRKLERINEYYNGKKYRPKKKAVLAKEFAIAAKHELYKLSESISASTPFENNFWLHLNKTTFGRSTRYKEWNWIDAVPKEFIDYTASELRAQPQIQIAIFNADSFYSSSIWLEPSSYTHRVKFIEILKRLKIKKIKNLSLYFEIDKISEVNDELINDKNLTYVINKLSENVNRKTGIKCSIRFIHYRNELDEKFNYELRILNDTKILLNNFSFIFDLNFIPSNSAEETYLTGMDKQTRKKLRTHLGYERDADFVNKYKRKYAYIKNCRSCNINPHTTYKLIKDKTFFELHHIYPLSKYPKDRKKIKIEEKDVILLCPNCHRAFHRIMSENDVKTINLKIFQKYYLLKKF